MTDPYLQLWASKPSTSTTKPSSKPSSDQAYRVDLDAPGGVTYSPSELANHNAKRRLFIPRKGAKDEEYDYGYEIAQRLKSQRKLAGDARDDLAEQAQNAFTIGEEEEAGATTIERPAPSAAQVYAQSINMIASSSTATSSQQQQLPTYERPKEPAGYAKSIAPSLAPSYRSTMTASGLARQLEMGKDKPNLFKTSDVVSTYRPAPSISGDSYRAVDPWNAKQYTSRREFDHPTEEEKEKGLTRWEEYAGAGNAPTQEEVQLNAERDAMSNSSDAATVRTTRTVTTSSQLKVSDLFIPDPRPFRALRLVRRTDPRQALVLCSGVALNEQKTQQFKALQAAAGSGIAPDQWKLDKAKALLAEYSNDDLTDLQAGIGLYFCPPDPTMGVTADGEKMVSPRAEPNFSRRMERVAFPYQTTARRAALRAVVAGLEYVKWEEEGFDKIVVGVSQGWIVSGITHDLHEWKFNNWRLTRQTILGLPGDTVPDQDLWELLDHVVSKWEEVDVSVRFWQLNQEEMNVARNLAEAGAVKEDQQPQLVKWTKKTKRFDL